VLTEQPLATFVDRHTMIYERTYAHPIERVWDAVSTGEHLDAWLLPESRVERHLGGAFAFGLGGSADDPNAVSGTITVWEPPTAVQYTIPDRSFTRFDLSAVDESTTALRFTLHFLPGTDSHPIEGDPGGDLPAGPDTAWRPGFLVGYHHMVGRLGEFLAGEWTLEDNKRDIERLVRDGWDAADLALMETYRQHVRTTIPPA
jgi:uncharacterized protein YndB with AHSA1/START domain